LSRQPERSNGVALSLRIIWSIIKQGPDLD
jgi:hypothetical protein